MREKLFAVTLAAALAGIAGSACAMTSAKHPTACQVIGAEQLPPESGGSDALCNAIAAAAAEQAPGVDYTIEVTVLPLSRLSAKITLADGRALPEQKFARMDKPLSNGAFQRFAASIAAELAKAGGRNS